MLHEMLIAQYGGLAGVRDDNMLESALAKPRQLFVYEQPTMTDLAASYAVGVVKNHPFFDGNKRTGFMLGAGFLERNGLAFTADEADVVLRTLVLAASEMTEAQYAAWFAASSHRP